MWLVWLAIALLAALAEVASLNFVLLMFAGGALAAAAADAFGAPLPIEVIVFGVVSAGLLAAARPPLLKVAGRTRHHATGVAALVGRQAEVVEEVDPTGGLVKLAGEVWSARAEGPGTVLPVGARVTVLRIDGATAVVVPEPPRLTTAAADDADVATTAGTHPAAPDPGPGPAPRDGASDQAPDAPEA